MSASIPAALVDTDILSAVMRQHPTALVRARAYLALHHRLAFSIITRYEILRGLHAKGATRQLAAVEQLCGMSTIVPLTEGIVVRAAIIYADLSRRGVLIGDADILIAATGLEHARTIVTNNEDHFRRITGLQIQNWLI